MMKITVINTGGTFNKVYNTLAGQLDVKIDHSSLENILKNTHNIEFEIIDILGKDSLDITHIERHIILQQIKESEHDKVIIIHGTDTMNETAEFLAQAPLEKSVVLTGAMIPMSIDEIEATINFSTALGFLNGNDEEGVYIAMHGAVVSHEEIFKNKIEGRFELKTKE